MDYPSRFTPAKANISTFSRLSLGPELAALAVAAAASATWATGSSAYFFPFELPEPGLATKLWAMNGAAVSGNIDMAIYDEFGVRLTPSAAAAQVNTNALQVFDIADTLIGRGRFLLSVVLDNTTGTLFRAAPAVGTVPQALRALGCYEVAASYPLPATVTYAAPAGNFGVPLIGALFGKATL